MKRSRTASALTRPIIAMHPALDGRLAGLSAGRTLIIDYFTSRTCGGVIGDLTTHWADEGAGAERIPAAPIEGVPIYVDARLSDFLADAGPELRPGGILRRGTPSIWLARPERWIDFLTGQLSRSPRRTP